MGSYLSPEQIQKLLAPIAARRVGRDGKGFSHIEGYEAKAHMTRLFGFARWDHQLVSSELVYETESEGKGGRPAWSVCYRAVVQVTVRSPEGHHLAVYSDAATGDAANQPSRADAHDLALKTASSQAFKRCCICLGDQFGLSLYNGGSLQPLVMRTLVLPEDEAGEETVEVDEHVQVVVPETLGDVEVERETSSPPDRHVPADEVAAAEETVAAAIPGATSEPEPEPLVRVLTLMEEATSQPPAQALQTLKVAMEIAVAKKLRTERMPASNKSVGAALSDLMKQASRHVGDAA